MLKDTRFQFMGKCSTILATHLAQMAKLVDALASGASASNGLGVRVSFWAQYMRLASMSRIWYNFLRLLSK